MYLNVSRSLKSVTDVKSDGLPSDGLTKISCIRIQKLQKLAKFLDSSRLESKKKKILINNPWFPKMFQNERIPPN